MIKTQNHPQSNGFNLQGETDAHNTSFDGHDVQPAKNRHQEQHIPKTQKGSTLG